MTEYTKSKEILNGPFSLIRYNCLKAAEPQQGDSLNLTTVPQELLVLIGLTSKEWKADSTSELNRVLYLEQVDWEFSALTISPIISLNQ